MGLRQLKIVGLGFAGIWLLLANTNAHRTPDEKHIGVSLRMIGHQVLLNAQDSSSRVLPIVKNGGVYKIQFESEFEFNPDELVNTVNQAMKDTKMARGYILEVEHCETGEVVYSYEIGDLEQIDIIPCRSRDQPKSCYNLLFTLTDKSFTLPGIGFSLPAATAGPSTASEMRGKGYPMLIALLSVLMALLAFVFWGRKKPSGMDPHLIPLGKYLFDQRNAALIMAGNRIELTGKEADLLFLLHQSANTTVERSILLREGWGDEGNYVGRTLDVFISKLRKKLGADPAVKIVNVRGVGYKLVVDG